jgi:hypothetical protein
MAWQVKVQEEVGEVADPSSPPPTAAMIKWLPLPAAPQSAAAAATGAAAED